ncbi:haloacid dehalogenase superfamily, subfamily IA, variant 3 with third motif having DD or ED/haloacid dehalogenase superfamily, subfamily IA, variant 1 with third motif having Dx(3-4)D or Dx(3-4)E [Haloplanus vescus]|uniref:Haloacid dehalogenase superfamily, subfamily IA, variant 3 with third motif having DD or ED/haloacid dehalogenase superfamily, subfamily IA, variant 1 with third motif having Dx(3-4)D or Dx(3-4)E n=1 Tax=Haloplanus vescus TaxID=555874 RepID=A0A1H3Y5X1_9EURY|nr:HAD-IA family hydrolase [Haloplanus vescus]SEA07059.1 haloacid dehalogenase superfamily, subfamily IA, variant 3 with third motif having DD or ED/haloacid dehalogenase superfamily, subfamily IA, variant 1 with third motif having Dx(3-4)D or Dx(3-4)E [Haloplanus vescus]
MTYEAVLFDNDGVLVEPVGRSVLRRATWEAFDALGVSDPDPDDVDRLSIGVTPDVLADVCDDYGLAPERFWRARDYHSSHAQRAELRAGRAALYDDFDAVRDIDAPRGIVSSNQQDTVEFMHDFFATRDLFQTAYGRTPTLQSLARKKPDPHYLHRALADLDVESALFVGDSESDLLAARNAGLDAAFIRRPHRESYDPSVTPTYELDGLADLLALDRVPVRGR